MNLISLAEAWQWVQVGFCAALGASVILGGIAATFGGGHADPVAFPDPHCSRCCPNPDDDEDIA